jgi:hypothetical protein
MSEQYVWYSYVHIGLSKYVLRQHNSLSNICFNFVTNEKSLVTPYLPD